MDSISVYEDRSPSSQEKFEQLRISKTFKNSTSSSWVGLSSTRWSLELRHKIAYVTKQIPIFDDYYT